MSSGEDVFLVEQVGHVLILRINRPEALNAVNLAVTEAMGLALEHADTDPEVRAVIVTATGERAFTAGADLKAFARGEPNRPEDPMRAAWGFAGMANHPISKPVIAAVNGLAIGGGTEMVLAADIAIAADHATFGLPEVRLGFYAGAGGVFRLVQQVPRKLGMELLLTGDPIDAWRAAELGIVNRVVPAADLMSSALNLAHRIAANAPLAVQLSKRLACGIIDGQIPGEAQAWAHCQREGAAVMASDDAKEGPKSFVEKRAPIWKGC